MSKLLEKTGKVIGGGLEPGEQLVAAARVEPKGGIRRSGVGALGGALGAAAMAATSKPQTEGDVELATKAHMVLVATDRRLLSLGTSAMTGGPKDVLGSIPLSSIASCSAEAGRAVGLKMIAIELGFTNGSSISLEVPRAFLADGQALVEALQARVSRA